MKNCKNCNKNPSNQLYCSEACKICDNINGIVSMAFVPKCICCNIRDCFPGSQYCSMSCKNNMVCIQCKSRPRFLGSQYCGNTCRFKAKNNMCSRCNKWPVYPGSQYCSKTCRDSNFKYILLIFIIVFVFVLIRLF